MSLFFVNLPSELVTFILAQLSSWDLYNVALVSKHFNDIASNDDVWEQKFLNELGFMERTDLDEVSGLRSKAIVQKECRLNSRSLSCLSPSILQTSR